MSKLDQFKSAGYCTGDSPEAVNKYQRFCFGKKRPFVCISRLGRPTIHITVQLYRGPQLTKSSKVRLMQIFTQAASGHRRPFVSATDANANIARSTLTDTVQRVLELLATPNAVIWPDQPPQAPISAQPV